MLPGCCLNLRSPVTSRIISAFRTLPRGKSERQTPGAGGSTWDFALGRGSGKMGFRVSLNQNLFYPQSSYIFFWAEILLGIRFKMNCKPLWIILKKSTRNKHFCFLWQKLCTSCNANDFSFLSTRVSRRTHKNSPPAFADGEFSDSILLPVCGK